MLRRNLALKHLRNAQREVDELRDRGEIDPETYGTISRAISTALSGLGRELESAPDHEPVPVAADEQALSQPALEPALASPPPLSQLPEEAQPESLIPAVQASPPPLPAATLVDEPRPEDHRPVAASLPAYRPDRTPDWPPSAGAEVGRRRPVRRRPAGLSAFMQARNIRWGEVVGALLVVFCSLALVISLWTQISANPLGQAGILFAGNAGLFGAGFFLYDRWKLRMTGRGMLVLSSLLVPLMYLALAAAFRERFPDPASVGVLAAGLVLFTPLLRRAARALAPASPWALPVAVLVPSIALLPLGASVGDDITPHGLRLASIPFVAVHAATVAVALAVGRGFLRLGRTKAMSILTLAGLGVFAALPGLGLLAFRAKPWGAAFRELSPSLAILSLPTVFAGAYLVRRLGHRMSSLRVGATAAALTGGAVLLAALALAWPSPSLLVGVSAVAAVGLIACALLVRVPPIQLPAGLATAFGGLIAVHAILGLGWEPVASTELARALFSATTGTALAIFGLVGSLATAGFVALGRKDDARYAGHAAAVLLVLGPTLVTIFGFGRTTGDGGATWVYAACAAAALVGGLLSGRREGVYFGSAFLLAAFVQGLSFRYRAALFAPEQSALFPLSIAFLGQHSVAIALGAIVRSREDARPLFLTSFVLSLAVPAFLIASFFEVWAFPLASWLAMLWLAIAFLDGRPSIFTAFQAAMILAAVLAAQQLAPPSSTLVVARAIAFTEAVGVALALVLVVFAGLRLLARKRGGEVALRTRLGEIVLGNGSAQAIEASLREGLVALLVALALHAAAAVQIPALVAGVYGTVFAARTAEWGWTFGALLALALVLYTRGELFRGTLRGLVFAGFAFCCFLGSAGVSPSPAVLRFTLAGYAVLGPLALGLVARLLRRPLAVVDQSRGAAEAPSASDERRRVGGARTLLLLVSGPPCVVLCILPAVALLAGLQQSGGPVSHGLPLLILAVGIWVRAILDAEPRSVLVGSILFQLAATVSAILAESAWSWPEILQLDAFLGALVALVWLGLGRLLLAEGAPAALRSITGLAAILLSIPLLVGGAVLFAFPGETSLALAAAGGFWGWAALLTVAVAALWLERVDQQGAPASRKGHLASLSAVWAAFAIQIVLTLARTGFEGWELLHAALLAFGGACLVSFVSLTVLLQSSERGDRIAAVQKGAWLFVLLVVLALRGATDPSGTAWTVGCLACLSALVVGQALWAHSDGALYAAQILVVAAVIVQRLGLWSFTPPTTLEPWQALLGTVTSATATLGLIGTWVAARFEVDRPGEPGLPAWTFHSSAAVATVGACIILAASVALGRILGIPGLLNPGSAMEALATTGLLLVFCLRDRTTAWLGTGFFAAGLSAAVVGLAVATPRGPLAPIWTVVVFGGYAAVVAAAMALGERVANGLAALRLSSGTVTIPRDAGLAALNSLLALAVVGLATWVVLATGAARLGGPDSSAVVVRLGAATLALVQAATFALMHVRTPREILRRLALWVGLAGANLWAWAWIDPASDGVILHRAVLTLAALAATSTSIGFLGRLLAGAQPGWLATIRKVLPWMLGLAFAALAFVLGAEIYQYRVAGAVTMAWPAISIVAITLAGLVIALFVFAVTPGHDPLGLSLRGRMGYVYVAEILLGLLFLHVRLTMPWLFSGFFSRYWPAIAMFLAFVGAGLSELFRRRQATVLAVPIGHTAAFLPILPILGYFAALSVPQLASPVPIPVLLGMAGLLYGLLSLSKRSLTYGVLAVLAANGGLWTFLAEMDGLSIAEHPQLWLIPPALSLLAATEIHKRNLSRGQIAGARYTCVSLLYASSASEILIHGVKDSPWLPLVLAGLSVVGIFAGMLLRVRSFLFLGLAFLIVALLAIVWHAAEHYSWTWIWWAFGVALGLGIFALFAYFERRRRLTGDVLGTLRAWGD